MSNDEKKLAEEFNANSFFEKLSELKNTNGLSFGFNLRKNGFHGELTVKTDIAVAGPRSINPKLDLGITKEGIISVCGDRNETGDVQEIEIFEDAEKAAEFVIKKAKQSLKL